MNRFTKSRFIVSAISATLLLTTVGCGGGKTKEDVVSTIKGKAVDGYLKNSTVWLDLNSNGEIDDGEPYTLSKSDGSYTLDVTKFKSDTKFDKAQIGVLSGTDIDTGNQLQGKLFAPNTGKSVIHVTPVTSLVAKVAKTDGNVTRAEQQVRKAFGLSNDVNLLADPKVLEENGDKSLISTALAVQKSIEFLAATVTTDPQAQETLQEKIYAAFAKVVSDSTTADTAQKVLAALPAGELDLNSSVVDNAKTLVGSISDSLENGGHTSSSVEKAVAIAINDKNVTQVSNILTKSDADRKKEFLVYRLKTLEVSDITDSLIQRLLNAGIDADKLITPDADILATLKEQFEGIYAKFVQAENEAKEDTEGSVPTLKGENLAFHQGEVIYDAPRVDHDDGRIKFGYHPLGTDGIISDEKFIYDPADGTFTKKEDTATNYILTSSGWQKDTGAYTINNEGSVIINDEVNVTKLSQISIASFVLNIAGQDKVIDMPSDAVKIKNEFSTLKDRYSVFNKRSETSLLNFIDQHCGLQQFSGDGDTGLSFAGTQNSDGSYSCDSSATSGKLFEIGKDSSGQTVVINEDAGSWNKKTVNTEEVLIAIPKKHFSGWEGDVFSVINGNVWSGDFDSANNSNYFYSLNQSAYDTIINYLKNYNSSSTNNDTTGFTPALLATNPWFLVSYNDNNTYCEAKFTFDDNYNGKAEYNDNQGQLQTVNGNYKIENSKLVTSHDGQTDTSTLESKSDTQLKASKVEKYSDDSTETLTSIYFKNRNDAINFAQNKGNNYCDSIFPQ